MNNSNPNTMNNTVQNPAILAYYYGTMSTNELHSRKENPTSIDDARLLDAELNNRKAALSK